MCIKSGFHETNKFSYFHKVKSNTKYETIAFLFILPIVVTCYARDYNFFRFLLILLIFCVFVSVFHFVKWAKNREKYLKLWNKKKNLSKAFKLLSLT